MRTLLLVWRADSFGLADANGYYIKYST